MHKLEVTQLLLLPSEVVDSDAWYTDFGASNHITSADTNLNQKAEYGGKGKLTIGDGNRLNISVYLRLKQMLH